MKRIVMVVIGVACALLAILVGVPGTPARPLAGLLSSAFQRADSANPSVVRSQAARSVAQATATTGGVIVGPDCPDVMVIAARGTGEEPLSNQGSLSGYTGLANHGAGDTLWDMYHTYLTALRPDLTFSLIPVIYPVPSLSSLSKIASALLNYESDARSGGSDIVLDIRSTDAECGHTVRYVLAGYSVGAWAVHDALNALSPAQLNEVAGVVLFGDPKFVPGQPFIRAFAALDVNHGVAALVDKQNNTIPGPVQADTGSWCFPDDPVCQFLTDRLVWTTEITNCATAQAAKCAHLQYTNQETQEAAKFLAPLMPPTSQFPQLKLTPPDGTVGVPYTWTASAAPAGSYTWSWAGGTPPGLSLSAAGTVSGTPTQAGTFTFSITATTAHGRATTEQLSLTVSPASGGSQPGVWTATGAPLPPDQLGASGLIAIPIGIKAISCPSTSACVAGGVYENDAQNAEGVLVAGSGTAWTTTEAPVGAPYGVDNVELNDVSCASAAACTAVGTYQETPSETQNAALFTGSGDSWTGAVAPLPSDDEPGTRSALNAVACPSTSQCVAVGWYLSSSATGPSIERGLLMTESGGSWSAIAPPLPVGAEPDDSSSLSTVTCASASACVAVGSYTDSSGLEHDLLVTGSGNSWSAATSPLPGDASTDPYVVLSAVTCASASQCIATGYYTNSSGTDSGLLVTGSGNSWSTIAPPLPADASNIGFTLGPVACASASQCVAIEYYTDSSGTDREALVTGSGNSWSVTTPPLPDDANTNPDVIISAVTCAPASQCVAVGSYTDSSNDGRALLITGSGNSWSAVAAPVPGDAGTYPGSFLDAVACPSASACTAAGFYYTSADVLKALLVSEAATTAAANSG